VWRVKSKATKPKQILPVRRAVQKRKGSLTTAYREEEKEYRINAVPRDGLRANENCFW
jgi:hypothetical protein